MARIKWKDLLSGEYDNIKRATIVTRMRKGLTLEQALNLKPEPGKKRLTTISKLVAELPPEPDLNRDWLRKPIVSSGFPQ
jgi:hypothetical protein